MMMRHDFPARDRDNTIILSLFNIGK